MFKVLLYNYYEDKEYLVIFSLFESLSNFVLCSNILCSSLDPGL